MDCQKIKKFLHSTSNQPSKFRKEKSGLNLTMRCVEYTTEIIKIRFKPTILKSSLFYYSDTYMLLKRIISVSNMATADVDTNNTNKKVKPKWIIETNNTHVDDAKDLEVVMPMYISGSLFNTTNMSHL